MSIVREEFGPTLPQLLRPYATRLPRGVYRGLAVLPVVVVAIVLIAHFTKGDPPGQRTVVVRRGQSFNFIYRPPFTRLAPQAGELARVGQGAEAFSVSALHLPAYTGDASAFLSVYAGQMEAKLERQLPGYRTRADGRTNINQIQGYQINYQYRPGGVLTFARLVLLLPTTTARDGVAISLHAPLSKAIANADAVGHNGQLKVALRSFRFGTKRP